MEQQLIIDRDLIGRYVAGRLSKQEAEQFEYAYFHDRRLAELVELEQCLQETLRTDNVGTARVRRPSWSIAAMVLLSVALLFSYVSIEPDKYDPVGQVHVGFSGAPVRLDLVRSGRESVPTNRVPIPNDNNTAVLLELPVSTLDQSLIYSLKIYNRLSSPEPQVLLEGLLPDGVSSAYFILSNATLTPNASYELVVTYKDEPSSTPYRFRFDTYTAEAVTNRSE